MKTLAAVTVTFLPGTFVASLFAIPLFQWQATPVVSNRFWIYWAVTIPLTLVTLLVWYYWTKRQTKIHRRQESKAQDALQNDIDEKGNAFAEA